MYYPYTNRILPLSKYVAIKTQLLDENKEVCVCLEGNISLEAGENGKVILEGKIKNPCLWSPEHPYLYQMRTRHTALDVLVLQSPKTPFW